MSSGEAYDRTKFRFTLVELLVALGVIVLLILLAMVAIATTRARARSSQCQSNLKQICLAVRSAQVNLEGRLRASELPAQLQSFLADEPGVWHCPSNELTQGVSYGFNQRLGRLHVDDGSKIVGLDYGKRVADVVGLPVKDAWPADVRPRHFDAVNVVFFDSHTQNLAAEVIDPRQCENQLRYWTPTLDRHRLPEECRAEADSG